MGLENLGAEEFVAKRFLAGEVYVDEKQNCYKDLQFKRFGLLSALKTIFFNAISKKALSDAKQKKINGNLSGDGLQNGGLLVVRKGGELLLFHKEEVPGEHCPNETILRTLGVSEVDSVATSEEKTEQVKELQEEAAACTDVCAI